MIERSDVEFILSHFEPPAFPRRISTFVSNDRQYEVDSIEKAMEDFEYSQWFDCRINASNYLGRGTDTQKDDPVIDQCAQPPSMEDAAATIQQRAQAEPACSVLDIDLDQKHFASDKAHKLALTKTMKKIKETFFLLDDDCSPATIINSGGGVHILLPFELDPAKYPGSMATTIGFTKTNIVPGRTAETARLFVDPNNLHLAGSISNLPASHFLRFAEKYLCPKADSGHILSVRSIGVRLPGSLNSKYKGKNCEVEIIRRWDGVTKCHIIYLLGDFYNAARKKFEERQRIWKYMQQHPRRFTNGQHSVTINIANSDDSTDFHNASKEIIAQRYWYIELLINGLAITDCRKRAMALLLAPYLINIQKLQYAEAQNIIMQWLSQCNVLRLLAFNAAEKTASAMNYAQSHGYQPWSFSTLKEEEPDLHDLLLKMQPKR